jgi:fatty-acyl-CoA synthase
MMHGAALWSTLISLYTGHTVVVNEQRHFDAEHIWSLIERTGVNITSGVGDAMALPLLQALEANPGRWPLPRLMIYGNGGAMLSQHLIERLKAALPQLMVTNGMGSSETGVTGGGEKPSAGEGLMKIAARADLVVFDAQLRPVTEAGGEGILARSGYTPIGYYGDAKKTAETFVTVDGRLWVLSGDLARIDPQGDIIVLGRGSQCITSGGEKIFPEEVEETARRYAAVADVLVVGLEDERWGQKVVAVIEVAAGQHFERAEFERICREHLSGYKVPKVVFLTERVQRSPAGKADYRWALDFARDSARDGAR